jgi:hypothetical protein
MEDRVGQAPRREDGGQSHEAVRVEAQEPLAFGGEAQDGF